MQLPPNLVDYVLAHELAHLHRPDHGPEFWRLVERAMPDYEARRDRLRRLGTDLWLPEAGVPIGHRATPPRNGGIRADRVFYAMRDGQVRSLAAAARQAARAGPDADSA